jgi:hypothetical protein
MTAVAARASRAIRLALDGAQAWQVSPSGGPASTWWRGRFGDWLVVDRGIPSADAVAIDLSSWPPSIEPLGDFTRVCDVTRDGEWLRCADGVALHAPGSPGPLRLSAPLPPHEGNGIALQSAHVIGDQVIAIGTRPPAPYASRGSPLPFRLEDDRFVLATDLPPAEGHEGPSPSREPCFVHGKAVLGDGSEVLIWDGDGYELSAGRFVRAFDLDCRDSFADWSSVPAVGDAFWYLSDRCVHEARRHSKPTPVARDVENVMSLAIGPAGALVLRQGMNKKNLVGCLWFPAERSYVPLRKKDLGARFEGAAYSEITRRLYVMFSSGTFATIPEETLLGLKRVRVRG